MESKFDEDVHFIKTELLPEMVHDRCFCEVDSREFVEFESASIEPAETTSYQFNYSIYRASVIVSFSGEPHTFHVLIKLLPENALSTDDPDLVIACGGFLNEEILCNKGKLQYGHDFFPKFYVADMGKYGRPVIVIEDLEKYGFQRVLDRELDQEEARKVVDLIGRFHGRGLLLKENKFSVFREFYAKFEEVTFTEWNESKRQTKLSEYFNQLKSAIVEEKAKKILEENFDANLYEKCKDTACRSTIDKSSTICQGLLLRENLWFKRNGPDNLELRILDWQHVRYGSNSLDLATILMQCSYDKWNNLIAAYVEAVQKEAPTISCQDLQENLSSSGFYYALFILSFQLYSPSDFADKLKFVFHT